MKLILVILTSSILLGIGSHTIEAADSCPVVCYDDSKFMGFCKNASGNECGINIIIDGQIVSTGLKTINGCGNTNPNQGSDCSGLKTGPCS